MLGTLQLHIALWISILAGVTHHCHIVETGNESWRFKESSTKGIATKRTKPRQTKIDQEELAIN
ncbi:ATP-binding protein [Acinetobacter baumannii]|uniref:hypothetical protein n=1 Tax=unclassified Acinetobacter TaxID=196816 RepID=UPI0009A372EA|nr:MULTISPECIES: hypothetical protein [Acinetobacter]MDU6159407.1 hypothetical protein [Acinetobacter sp.]MBE2347075.1 hypothetical protein [Acinetobacter baumannii]MBF6868043.1 hypothetical protein [Acinetobacter baumannii]MBJ8428685.1 hypothetical protein [Acinetobacter bereziniae]MBJ8462404.1 hypothetical protein [Acinetobacter nosocomialis]